MLGVIVLLFALKGKLIKCIVVLNLEGNKMLNEIVDNLKSMTCKEIKQMSAEIGVSYDGLIKIRLRIVSDPKLSTALAIQKFFNEK